MAVTNQRTVTIKMTRGQALRLCRLITLIVHKSETQSEYGAVTEWLEIHDKVRAGVDALDQKEAKHE